MKLSIARLESPLGDIVVVATDAGLCALDFAEREALVRARLERRFGPVTFAPAADPACIGARLRAYFEGELDALQDVAVDPGGTPFQRRVWNELRRVAAGRTTSYAELAWKVGRPGAARAVGLANGSNPIALVIPCHRAIGSDGSLTGYAGGLARKLWLLDHEGALASVAPRSLGSALHPALA